MSNPFGGENTWEPVDAAWVILCAFIVWTMQPGFVLLESGINFSWLMWNTEAAVWKWFWRILIRKTEAATGGVL